MYSRITGAVSSWSGYAYETSKYVVTSVPTFAYNLATATRDTGYQIASVTGSILGMKPVQQGVADLTEEGFQGFVEPLNPGTEISILRSKKTRRVEKHSLTANVIIYLGAVFAYEFGVKSAINYFYPDFEESWEETAMNYAARSYFFRLAVRAFIDNFFYSAAVSKTTYDDYKPDPRFLKDCEHGASAGILPNYISTFTFLGSSYAITAVEGTMPFYLGKVFGTVARAKLSGDAFLDIRSSTVWTCEEDRAKIRRENWPYAFGWGASFVVLNEFINWLIKYETGVDSWFVRDAIFAVLYQRYVVNAVLQSRKPLPGTGKRVGFDTFHYPYKWSKELLVDLVTWLWPHLKDQNSRGDFAKTIKNFRDFPPIKLIEILLLKTELRSILDKKELKDITEFEKRPALLLYFGAYGNSLVATIDGILEKRNDKVTKAVHKNQDGIVVSGLKALKVVSEEDINMLNIVNLKEITNVQLLQLRRYFIQMKKLADDLGYGDDPKNAPVNSPVTVEEVDDKEKKVQGKVSVPEESCPTQILNYNDEQPGAKKQHEKEPKMTLDNDPLATVKTNPGLVGKDLSKSTVNTPVPGLQQNSVFANRSSRVGGSLSTQSAFSLKQQSTATQQQGSDSSKRRERSATDILGYGNL